MAKMTDRELIRLALHDGITLQSRLADGHGTGTVASRAATSRMSQYQEMLDRKYGEGRVAGRAKRDADKRVLNAAEAANVRQ